MRRLPALGSRSFLTEERRQIAGYPHRREVAHPPVACYVCIIGKGRWVPANAEWRLATMDAARAATMGMSSALRDVAVAAQSVSGVSPTDPNSQRIRIEETDTRRGSMGSSLPGGQSNREARPAVDAYRLPVGGNVGLDPDLVQQFTPLSSDGLDVTQGMAAMIIGRQAFQANRNAYQAAQSLLDSTLKVGL